MFGRDNYGIRLQLSSMKDFSVGELLASIKYEFGRHYSNSQQIITRLYQDFITRYSSKPRYEPYFLSQDATTVVEQLILYADECVQIMSKFECLQRGAAIVNALTNSAFKMIRFLNKELSKQTRNTFPGITKASPMCDSCGKLRDNQNIKVLREELLDRRGILESEFRKWQKQEDLESFWGGMEQLHEDQVKKRLGKMEQDHDHRRQEMTFCLQELERFNDKVVGYNKKAEKSRVNFVGKFDAREYIFSLSRHFQHNLSSIELKLRQMRQGLSHQKDYDAQTEDPCISLALHQELLTQANIELTRSRAISAELQLLLSQETKKNQQCEHMIIILQDKLRQVFDQRQKLEQSEKILNAQLTVANQTCQSKIIDLENVIRKIKKEDKTGQKASLKNKIQEASVIRQNTGEQNIDPITELQNKEDKTPYSGVKVIGRMSTTVRLEWRESKLLRPQFREKSIKRFKNFDQKESQISQQSISEETNLNKNKEVIDEAEILQILEEQIMSGFQRQKQNKIINLSLYSTVSECIQPTLQIKSGKILERGLLLSEKLQKMEKKEKNLLRERKKLTKISQFQQGEVPRVEVGNQLVKNGHEPLVSVDECLATQAIQSKTVSFAINLGDLNGRQTRMLQLVKPKERGKKYKEVSNKLPHESSTYLSSNGKTKKRYMSQQNSFQGRVTGKTQIVGIKAKQGICKERFNEEDRQALFQINDIDPKLRCRNSYYKKEGYKSILSLQEINYSTYFFSMVANLHLRNFEGYEHLRQFLAGGDKNMKFDNKLNDEKTIRQAVTQLLVMHRRCSSGGQICKHLEVFMEKIRNL